MNAKQRRALLAVCFALLAACGQIDLRKPRTPDPGPPPQSGDLKEDKVLDKNR